MQRKSQRFASPVLSIPMRLNLEVKIVRIAYLDIIKIKQGKLNAKYAQLDISAIKISSCVNLEVAIA